jgi:hypothetical protein
LTASHLIKFFIHAAVIILCIFIYADIAHAAKAEYVDVEGYASIAGGSKSIARENALNNAFRRAVEQAVGVLVESETLVKNFQLVNDRIYSKSEGYIKKYTITREKVEGDEFKIAIKALVSRVKIEKDLGEIGLLIKKAGKPRLMLLISEQNVISDKPSYWWGGGVNIGIAENTIMEKLAGKGFSFVDRQVVVARARSKLKSISSAGPDINNDAALKLASMGEAEVVIIGQAVAKAGTPLMGTTIRSCQATISVRALNADNGELLASAAASATAPHVDTVTGGSEAMKKASLEISDKLMSQILAKWEKRVSGIYMIKLTVSGLKFDRVKEFRQFLKDQIDSIEEIYDRSYKDGVADLDIEISGSTGEIAEELSGKKFRGGIIEVKSSTSNVIEIIVK